MKVQARCVARAWESNAAVMFEPGMGPLPGGLYEIDRDGPLAVLKVGKDYVFDFDRNAPGQIRDYTCDKCQKKCKTLNELGTHVHTEHPIGAEPEPEVFADRTCATCGQKCKSPYGLRLHMERKHRQPEAEHAVV